MDDGSSDGTRDRVLAWAAERPGLRVRCVQQQNAGPAAARNRGARAGRGRVIIFLDDDMLVEPGFVDSHVAEHAVDGLLVVGTQTPPPPRTGLERHRYVRWLAFHEDHAARGRVSSGVTGANMSMRASSLRELGGFDESFTIASSEDWELGHRARQQGYEIVYAPHISAVHNDWADTLGRYMRRQSLYSKSDVLLYRKYGEESPRAPLVRTNSPVDLRRDGAPVVMRKLAKSALATRAGTRGLNALERLAESVRSPDKVLTGLYRAAEAAAIWRGVQEGVQAYPASRRHPVVVVHLIDKSGETAYFNAIADLHSRSAYRLAIGSVAPADGLQQAIALRGCGTFSLDAPRRRDYLAASLRLYRILRATSADIIHAHCFDPTLLAWAAARAARCRFVYTRHHSDHNLRLRKWLHVLVDAWCARRADHIIAVSQATKSVMTDVERVPPSKITVVHNGMRPMAAPGEVALTHLRQELDLPSGPVLLIVGRLHDEKGHDVLLEALPMIEAAVGPVNLLVAGDGPDKARLENEVTGVACQGRILFLGQRTDVPALMLLADVVVVPSRSESFGFVVLEAMSLGRPVVASAVGGVPELLVDDSSGLLVKPGDPHELAAAVTRLVQDPAEARRIGEMAEQESVRFTAQGMVAGYEAVYETVLSAARGVSAP